MNSKSNYPLSDGLPVTRRRFLKRATLLCGAAGALATVPAIADMVRRPRVLQFVHTHTGEALVAPYFDSTGYRVDTLRDVNHLLRDFRTGESHVIDPPLLDILYELQLLADRDATYEIISGYRSPMTNAMLRGKSHGVAERSQHLLGKAIDVRLSGFPTRQLGEYARSLARGGVGFYASSDFIHLDTSRVRFW